MKKGDWIEYETVQRPGKKIQANITGIWPDMSSVWLDLFNVRNWSINLKSIRSMRVISEKGRLI